MNTETTRATEIAKLNDAFRKGYTFMMTPGVQELQDAPGIIESVQTFRDFTEDNDPYGEHDFGSFKWHNETIFWKIDYYNMSLRSYCDPLDADCTRVLTIMLAEG